MRTSWSHSTLDHKEYQKSIRIFARQFYGLMKPNWNCLDIWTSSMSDVRKARLMTRIPSLRSTMEVGH